MTTEALNACAGTMFDLGAASTCVGRPGSMFACTQIGELIVGVVWRGGSDARFGYGRLERFDSTRDDARSCEGASS